MKITEIRAWIEPLWHKYKYVLLIAVLGICLLTWPSRDTGQTAAGSAEAAVRSDVTELEEKLERHLARAEGVGRVAVVLSVQSEPERVLAADTDVSVRRDAAGDGVQTDSRLTHVIVSDGKGSADAVTLRTEACTYRGALVICDGGDRASVRLTVTQAVAALTGLPSDKIVVVRMD